MICKCGNKLENSFKFCPNCGESVPKPKIIKKLTNVKHIECNDRKYTVKTALTEYFQGTIGETKLREAIRAGEIPHFRIGSRIILRQVALDAWATEQERKSVTKSKELI